MKKTKNKFTLYIVPTIAVLLMVALLWPIIKTLLPELLHIIQSGNYDSLVPYLRSFGALGIAAVILLQILQVITIIIPSPFIWIPAGIVFGVFEGLLFCLIGLLIGNAIAFLISRKLKIGTRSKQMEKVFAMMNQIKSPDLVLFLVSTLPGMPNGLIPYFYAPTKYSLPHFLLIIGMGSIPSILMSTLIGQLIIDKSYLQAGILMAVIAVTLLLLVWKKDKFLSGIAHIEEKWNTRHE